MIEFLLPLLQGLAGSGAGGGSLAEILGGGAGGLGATAGGAPGQGPSLFNALSGSGASNSYGGESNQELHPALRSFAPQVVNGLRRG